MNRLALPAEREVTRRTSVLMVHQLSWCWLYLQPKDASDWYQADCRYVAQKPLTEAHRRVFARSRSEYRLYKSDTNELAMWTIILYSALPLRCCSFSEAEQRLRFKNGGPTSQHPAKQISAQLNHYTRQHTRRG